MAVHILSTRSVAVARQHHPKASIIRPNFGTLIVFDNTEDARGHSSTLVVPPAC